MRFIRLGKPVYVRGNFGEQLVSFIKGFKTQNIDVLEQRLKAWYEAEVKLLAAREQESKIGYITDKYNSLLVIVEQSDTVEDCLNTIINLVTPNAGTVLSSIHRAKGTEAKRVYFYAPSLLPSKWAKSPAALQQEQNLRYVAGTRALSQLYFVEE